VTTLKTVLITGGNRGIGKGLVEGFLSLGHTVYFTSRHAYTIPGATNIILDVTDSESITKAIETFNTPIDLLINNAGILLEFGTPAVDVSIDNVERTFNVNVLGPLRMIQALKQQFSEGARIINVSSGLGQLADMQGDMIGYRMSKTALNALTIVLSKERPDLKVNSICPGWVQTDMGGVNATRTVNESVSTIIEFALTDDFPTGTFVRDGQPIAW